MASVLTATTFRRHAWVIEIGILLILALTVLLWFRGDTIIMTSASVWPLNWEAYLSQTISIWDDSIGTGAVSARQVAALPLALVGAKAEAAGLSASVIQKIIFFIWFAGSGLAMWLMCAVAGLKRLARMNAALFYMISPYALTVIWSQTDGLLMPVYATFPLIFGLYLWVLTKGGPIKYILLSNLVLAVIGTAVSFTNPAYAAVLGIPLLFVAILMPALRVVTWRVSIRTTILLGIFWCFFNAFWLVPILGSVIDEFTQASHQILQAEDPSRIFRSDLDTFAINSVLAIDGLRLTGIWPIAASNAGDPYYEWGAITTTLWWQILALLTPVIIIIGLLKTRRRSTTIIFSLVFLVGLFIIIGVNPPGDGLRLAILEIVPGLLRAFRAVYAKVGILVALGGAPLFGLGISAIYQTIKQRQSLLANLVVATLMLLTIGVGGWPAWSGSVINPGGLVLQPARVRIPSFYQDMQEWLSKQPDLFRVLPLPLSKTGSTAYHWEDSGYIGGDFIRHYSPDHPFLFAGTRNPLMLALVQYIDQPSFASVDTIPKILELLNARYVLVHEDFHWPVNANFMMFNDQSTINSFAYDSTLFDQVERWRDLVLLQPKTATLQPKIYTVARPIYTVSSGANIADALTLLYSTEAPALYVHDPLDLTNANQMISQLTDEVIVTTSIDDEALAQARRDLSDARSALSPFVKKREVEIELVQRSFKLNEDSSLFIPQSGQYDVYIAQAWLVDKQAPVSVSVTDNNSNTHPMENQSQARDSTQHYRLIGNINLPAGDSKLYVSVGDSALTTLPPGTLVFRKKSADLAPKTPTIASQQLFPHRYTATVRDASAPFVLVLSETYHPGWQATVTSLNGKTTKIPDSQHIRINGYANAWLIDNNEPSTISISFVPQRFVWYGLWITGLTITTSVLLLIGFGLIRLIPWPILLR